LWFSIALNTILFFWTGIVVDLYNREITENLEN